MHRLFFLIFFITISAVSADFFPEFASLLAILSGDRHHSSQISDLSLLHNAINANNPDEDMIINILTSANANEREILNNKYQNIYNVNLVNDLKDKLTGKFEEAVVALMTPLQYYYVQEIRDAIYGVRSDEKALIDTLCIFNQSSLNVVKAVYSQYYGRSMEHELRENTMGSFKKLMIACSHNMRDPSIVKDHYVRKYLSSSFSEDEIISYMTKSSYAQILQLTLEYKSLHGRKIEDIVAERFSGDFKRALLGIFNYALSEKLYLVIRFHESLEGNEVDYRSLLRLVLMEKTYSYSNIREFYEKLYKKNLDNVIANKIPHGSYRKLIEALLRHQ